MLDAKTYTKKELVELFGTDRLDSIKNKLKRKQYKFTTSGRGDNFTLTITSLPLQFREFCINELGFAPQSDFQRLKKFLYLFFCDAEFQKLPLVEMEREMDKKEIPVTRQTIQKWIRKLIDNDLIWRSFAEFNYYVVHSDKKITYIDKETYSESWKKYWEGRQYSYCEACSGMNSVVKGTPHKVGQIIGNAFGRDKFDRLIEILNKEKDIDE